MALTGQNLKLANDFLDSINTVAGIKTRLDVAREKRTFESALDGLTAKLREAAKRQDAELSNQLEKVSIAFEHANYAVTKDDVRRLEKQTSENGASEKSLEFVQDKRAYKEYIERLFPTGITRLPEGEPYITNSRKQIAQLGQAQKGMSSAKEKDFFSARQDNLRAGIVAFKELQTQALFPERTREQGSVEKKGLDDQEAERIGQKGQEIERSQKTLLESEQKYDSALQILLESKTQEMKNITADMDKAIAQQQKAVTELAGKKPKMLGKKEWQQNYDKATSKLKELEKQKSDILKDTQSMKARVTKEFRERNTQLTVERDNAVKRRQEEEAKRLLQEKQHQQEKQQQRGGRNQKLSI